MCGQQIDALPQRASSFSISWPGVVIGLVIVFGLTHWFFQMQSTPVEDAVRTESVVQTSTRVVALARSTPAATHTITPTPTPPPTLTPIPASPTTTPTPVIHTIRSGEALLFIASRYRVTVEDILAANPGITEETILQIDQKLIIPVHPGGIGGPEPIREGPVITYVVKSGDTLSDIAFEHDVSLFMIQQANPGLDPDFLSVGQAMVIPLRPPTFTPTPPTTPTPTFTPGLRYQTPYLLLPSDGALMEGDNSTVLLSWTASAILDENTFYVVSVTAEAGETNIYWTQASSYRLPAEARPPRLTSYTWQVTVMEQPGFDENGVFHGRAVSAPSVQRAFRWR